MKQTVKLLGIFTCGHGASQYQAMSVQPWRIWWVLSDPSEKVIATSGEKQNKCVGFQGFDLR